MPFLHLITFGPMADSITSSERSLINSGRTVRCSPGPPRDHVEQDCRTRQSRRADADEKIVLVIGLGLRGPRPQNLQERHQAV